MRFTHYVALGDSMSSDHYPTCDVRGVEFPPPRLDPLGAAALLHRNDDSRWEEFSGRDLVTRCPELSYTDLTEDGARRDDVLLDELPRLGLGSGAATILVTLTVGGNDLLDAVFARRPLDMAARLGGEEFAVVLYDCSQADGLRRIEELRRQVESLDLANTGTPLGHVTISAGGIGVHADVPMAEAYRLADTVLYAAKHQGRNRTVIAEPLTIAGAAA